MCRKNVVECLVLIFTSVDAGWRDITFKFDGFLTGVGDLADTLLNKLGVGRLIVERQKVWIDY